MQSPEIERRLPVWEAMSDLFLDTEITEDRYRYIARRVIESGYGKEEVERILWLEVFPVLESNLRNIVGEWAGFSRQWLRKNICISNEASERPAASSVVDEITRCWARVCEFLPEEYR